MQVRAIWTCSKHVQTACRIGIYCCKMHCVQLSQPSFPPNPDCISSVEQQWCWANNPPCKNNKRIRKSPRPNSQKSRNRLILQSHLPVIPNQPTLSQRPGTMATAKVSLSPYQKFPKTQRIVANNKFLLSKLVYLFGHPKTIPFIQLGSSAQSCVSTLPCCQSHADY